MRKLSIFFLFLIILPIVSASYFTGSFSDYGKDTDSDSLFNYLTIESGTYISSSGDYIISGILKDSQGNILEYNDCKSLPKGAYTFILDFDGRQLYRNQVDGPYNLKSIELSSISDCNSMDFPILEDSLQNAYNTSFYNYKEFQKGEPAIYCNNSPCVASSDLIKSRDHINHSNGAPAYEPNAPNTIDNCQDGTKGKYLNTAESIENITITDLNDNIFKIGDTVKVEAFVYCTSTYNFDKINFVYTNDTDNIQWKVKYRATCPSTGLKKLSTTFILDKTGYNAIRGVFGFNLQPNTVCGQDDPQYYWADTDDVVIYVNKPIGYELTLTKGWNLISLPKIENKDINEIINILGNIEKIVALKDGKWYIYDKLNITNSNLNELSEENGFWVKANDNISVSIDNESALYAQFNLSQGWNLIGYPSMEEKQANELFQNVMDDIELIYIYNPEFKSFNPLNPSNLLIKPGMGIFVKAKYDTKWYFDNVYNKGEQTFNLNLTDGWNLISIPLQSNKTISEIFGSKTLYYLENNKWKQLEGNNKINYSYAYWAKANESSLIITGNPINTYFDINQGWNLINYPLRQEKNINEYFQNVMSNIEIITTFEDAEWKSYNPSKPNELNSLTTLRPGKGIFIKAKNNQKWHFNSNELVAT